MNELAIAGQSPAAFFEDYLRLNVNDGAASPRTIKAYQEGLCAFLTWCRGAGAHPLAASRQDLQEYRTFLNARYKRSTARLRLLAVQLLFKAMQAQGLRADNPAAGIRAAKDRTTDEERVIEKALSLAEAQAFMRAIPKGYTRRGARDRAMIFLMLLAGLRAEEVCLLTWGDIGESRAQVLGKGNKKRSVDLTPSITASLKSLRSFLMGREIDSTPVFTPMGILRPNARRLTVRTVERVVDRALSRCNLKRPGRSAHSLRHTYAMLCVLTGGDREALQASMGHADMATTTIYTHAASRFQNNPAAGLEAALNQENEKPCD